MNHSNLKKSCPAICVNISMQFKSYAIIKLKAKGMWIKLRQILVKKIQQFYKYNVFQNIYCCSVILEENNGIKTQRISNSKQPDWEEGRKFSE